MSILLSKLTFLIFLLFLFYPLLYTAQFADKRDEDRRNRVNSASFGRYRSKNQVSMNISMKDKALNQALNQDPDLPPYPFVRWNERKRIPCSPNICQDSNLAEIPGYANNVPIQLLNSTSRQIFDHKRLMKCFSNKYILILGDSSTTEHVHNLMILLSGAGYTFDRLVNYTKTFVHKSPNSNSTEEYVLNYFPYPQVDIQYIGFNGHRNITVNISSHNLTLIHRFNGGGSYLNRNYYGLPFFLDSNWSTERACLFGDQFHCPYTTRQPDIVVFQSAHHDVRHSIPIYEEAVKNVTNYFQMLKQQKTLQGQTKKEQSMNTSNHHYHHYYHYHNITNMNIFWMESINPRKETTYLVQRFNNIAAKHVKLRDLQYISLSSSKVACQQIPGVSLQHDYWPHCGIINTSLNKYARKLFYSSYLTQTILQHLCPNLIT
jgi:hypothetical protein